MPCCWGSALAWRHGRETGLYQQKAAPKSLSFAFGSVSHGRISRRELLALVLASWACIWKKVQTARQASSRPWSRHLFSPPIYLLSPLSPAAAAVVTSKLWTPGKGHTSCSQNSSLQVPANELTTSNSLVIFFPLFLLLVKKVSGMALCRISTTVTVYVLTAGRE